MAAPTTDPTAVDDHVGPELLAELRRYHATGVTRDIGWRTGQLAALERMLSASEGAEVSEAYPAELQRMRSADQKRS